MSPQKVRKPLRTSPRRHAERWRKTQERSHSAPPHDTPRHASAQSGGLEVPSSNLGAPIDTKAPVNGAFCWYLGGGGGPPLVNGGYTNL
jgi:hypothetical protein